MGIPPGVPVKAAKSIGPCPSYCRADCPGTQRPAHPPGACPGVPAAWLPAAALRLIRKVLFIAESPTLLPQRGIATLGVGLLALPFLTGFHHRGQLRAWREAEKPRLKGGAVLIDFNRQALRLRRLASSGDR